MRWQRDLSTGGTLAVAGHQVFIKSSRPEGQGVEDVTWWSDLQVSSFLERYAVGGFARSGADWEQLKRFLAGRRRPAWASLQASANIAAARFAVQLRALLAEAPVALQASWQIDVACSEVAICCDGESVAVVRCEQGCSLDLLGDRPDVALLCYASLRLAALDLSRTADLRVQTHAGSEHIGACSDIAAGKTHLLLLGVPMPFGLSLSWFPARQLGLSGELHSDGKEGATIIDF